MEEKNTTKVKFNEWMGDSDDGEIVDWGHVFNKDKFD